MVRKTSERQRQLFFFLQPNNGLINLPVIQNSIDFLLRSRHLKIHDGDHIGHKQEYNGAANLHLNDIGTRPAPA